MLSRFFALIAVSALPTQPCLAQSGQWDGPGRAEIRQFVERKGGMSDLPVALYGDFNGDGHEDAVVFVYMPSGESSVMLEVALFRGENGRYRFVRNAPDVYGEEPRDAVFSHGSVQLTTTMPRPGDPRCCPTGSQHYTIRTDDIAPVDAGIASAPAPSAVEMSYPATLSPSDITDIQLRLNSLGFDAGRPDGVAGRRTRAAIQAFQRSLGNPPTGQLTGQEFATLSARTGGGPTAAAVAGVPPVPDRFLGVWQYLKEDGSPVCGPEDFDLQVTIEPNMVSSIESVCLFMSVQAPDADADLAPVRLAMSCAEEGTEWEATEIWQVQRIQAQTMLLRSSSLENRQNVYVYQQCSAGLVLPEPVASTGDLRAPGNYCYAQSHSTFNLMVQENGEARFDVESAQGGAHICGLVGTALPISDGWSYSEAIENGGQCRLDIVVAADGSVSFRDPDWTCKSHYCGHRAAFEHIEFSPSDRRSC